MRDGLYRVETSRLCAGFVVEGGNVVACAPILRRNLTRWATVAHLINPGDSDMTDQPPMLSPSNPAMTPMRPEERPFTEEAPQHDPYAPPETPIKVVYRRTIDRGAGAEGYEVGLEVLGYENIDRATAYCRAKVFDVLGIPYVVQQDGSVEEVQATPAQQVAQAFAPAEVQPLPGYAPPPQQTPYQQQVAPQPVPQQGMAADAGPPPSERDYGSVRVRIRNANEQREALPDWLGPRLVEEGFAGFVEVHDNRGKIADGTYAVNAPAFKTVSGQGIWQTRKARS